MTVVIANLFHDVFKDKETGEASNSTTVSSRVSESLQLGRTCMPTERGSSVAFLKPSWFVNLVSRYS